MTYPNHFSVIDGHVSPQPWMQQRLLKTASADPVTRTYDPSDGIARNEVLQSMTLQWTNNSPVNQYVYGMVTRDGSRVTLQTRTRAYLMTRHGALIGSGTVAMNEVGRFGGGADVGKGGLLALGASYAIHELRSNSSSMPFMPQYAGQYLVEPGETITCKVDVSFKSDFWESSNIDGSDSGTESSVHAGEIRLDLYGLPTVDLPPPRLQPTIVGGAGGVTSNVNFNTNTVCAVPAGIAPGDVLVAITCTQFGFAETIVPLEDGWTLAHQRGEGFFGFGDVHMKIWTRNVNGGEPSTFGFGGSFFSEGITLMFAVRGALPFDGGNGNQWYIASNLDHWKLVEEHVAPSIDKPGQLLICASYFDHSPTQAPLHQASPDGMTEIADVAGQISTIAVATLATPPQPTFIRRFEPTQWPVFRGHSIAVSILIPGEEDV